MVLSKAIATFQQVQTRSFKTAGANDFRYFTLKGMKKHYAVIPLVVIIAGAMVGMTGFIVYSCRSRTDVYFSHYKPSIAESMDMMNPQQTKLAVFNQEYRPMPELAAALKARDEE